MDSVEPILVFITIICIQLCYYTTRAAECKHIIENGCKCELESGGVVDLSSLGNKDGTPRFANIGMEGDHKHKYTYSWNPCYKFDYGDNCKNVFTCQKSASGSDVNYFNLGDVVGGFTPGNENNQLVLNYTTKDSKRTTEFILTCVDEDRSDLIMLRENNGHYYFRLESHCACGGGCVPKISTGSILLLFLVIGLSMYLLVGCCYLRIIKGAQGKESLPNYGFWSDLPFLIRDGCVFTISGCKTTNEAVAYDKI